MIQVNVRIINSDTLLCKINDAIDSNQISTWGYDDDGDYTAIPQQWNREAWMHPIIVDKKTIKFGIVQRRDASLTQNVYAVYHGRFAEMLLMHFDRYISNIEISSLLIEGVDVFEK